MDDLFLLLLLAAFASIFVGLAEPRWVGMKSRSQAFLVSLAATFVFLVLFGMTVEEAEETGERADLPDTLSAPAAAPARDGGFAGGEPIGVYVLRSDSGQVGISSRLDLWDRAYRVAELPPGSEVELLERTTTMGEERCRVRTPHTPRVAGWVMCADLR